MIQCYYTKETLGIVAKSGRYRAIGCGSVWWGLPVLLFTIELIRNPGFLFRNALFLLIWCIGWFGISYLFHWLLCNIEKTTLQHAGDEITLDDNEIRLVKSDGTQITLPRQGLTIRSPYYACGNQIFKIRNSRFTSSPEIVLTSDMENAKELVETIQPGSWDEGE